MANAITKKEEEELKRLNKSISSLGKTYNELMDDIRFNTSGSTSERKKELDQISKEVEKVINDELSALSKINGADISSFIVELFSPKGPVGTNRYNTMKSMDDLFQADDSAMMSYFINSQKEDRILYNELDMISSQLYELKEAVNTIRDSIITSDDISKTIARSIKFEGRSEEELEDISAIKHVEEMEKHLDIQKKIKNFIVPNTLTYGEYYAYTIPYSELFKKYYNLKKAKENGTITESSYTVSSILKEKTKGKKLDAVTEMATVIYDEMKSSSKTSIEKTKLPSKTEVTKIVEGMLDNIEVHMDEVPIPVLEGEDIDALMDFEKQRDKILKSSIKKSTAKGSSSMFADGVSEKKKDKDSDFSFVTNKVYEKLIPKKNMTPIKILDETIGYIYAYGENIDTLQPFSNSIKMIDASMITKGSEDTILTTITRQVVKSFDKPFLEKNEKFKDFILNSLIYDDMSKKRLKFQFIPVDYVTRFSVNEDENGNGQSVLRDSLFYAKLYLSLLIFKVIQILTKSSDTRIFYIKQSGLDQDVMNGIQNAARQVKAKQINYYDIMNPMTSTTKIGNNNEIFVPLGRSSEKGFEIDTMAGQDVQLDTPLMEMLKQAYINGTGVPSVIMQYINEADYAKTLVMANSKFVGRVSSLQTDFNSSITEYYKKLLRFTTDLPEEIIESMSFTFTPPKSVNTQNLNELTAATDQVVQYMIQTFTGQNADMGELNNRLKDKLAKKLATYFLPTLPWGELQNMARQAMIEIKEEDEYNSNQKTNDGEEVQKVPYYLRH